MAFIDVVSPQQASGRLEKVYKRVRSPDGQVFTTAGAQSAPAAGGLNFRIQGVNLIGVTNIHFSGTEILEALACNVDVQTPPTKARRVFDSPSPSNGLTVRGSNGSTRPTSGS